jgi:exodeoxyribonuclease X
MAKVKNRLVHVIDTETTGTKPPEAAVCEIASVSVDETGKVLLDSGVSSLVNPGHPCPADARGVHHLSDAELAKAPPFKDVMRKKFSHLKGSIVCAHNMPFDWPFIAPGLDGDAMRLCTLKIAKHLYPDSPNHKNQTLRYHLKAEPPASALKGLAPHRALYDAYCTAFILARMIKDAGGLDELIRLTSAPVLLKTCHLKAHKGKPWEDVPPDYLRWVLRVADFDPDIHHTARHHLGLNHVA